MINLEPKNSKKTKKQRSKDIPKASSRQTDREMLYKEENSEENELNQERIAKEELKEVDLKYLIGEEADIDDLFPLDGKKKKRTPFAKKAESEVTFKPLSSPYIPPA